MISVIGRRGWELERSLARSLPTREAIAIRFY